MIKETGVSRSATRPLRREAATHLFAVGQTVRLKGGFGLLSQTAGVYQITARLPPRGNSPQYRIRSDDERHERVATQDSLETVSQSSAQDGAALLERTFGHGQGTETQLARDQEAEAGQGSAQA
nr:hypothetical protein [Mesorhizobium sp.]